MEAAAPDGAAQASPPPAEADRPPEPRPPPLPAAGTHDPHFLSSIIGDAAPPPPPPPLGQKRKRGRPPKRKDGAAVAAGPVVPAPAPALARAARRRQDEEEVVCFICFDGGNLVVCDRRGCPKVYHPACIKRDEAFFQSRSKWNCGWHICSSCEKAVHYMCYTCTYSLCKVCIKQGKFFSVRGTKGFCDTCYGTILLIECKDESATKVDFDDILSWEYLFKLYWLDLKGKLSLTLEELTTAKNRWNVPSTSARKEKEESSDDLYDANNDDDAGSDCSSGKRRRTNSRKKGQKRRKVNRDCSILEKKVELPLRNTESIPVEVPNERVPYPVHTKVPNGRVPMPVDTKVPNEPVSLAANTKWASPELLEFIGHMRNGDQSFISQFDVQTLLLDYIKKNNLRDPQRKSQIICDSRLHFLFRKARVAHFEMLKLLEMHFLTNETSTVTNSSQVTINLNSAHVDTNGHNDTAAKVSPDKRRRIYRKMERDTQVNLEDYAAIDMHNINLIYMRRSLMEDLVDDVKFSDKIHGGFVRIKISDVCQKQDIYRLVKVIGTHKVPEKYSIGKKMTNVALEILNLNKKEIITMDTISNHDFTEEECKRLRQSMKCDLISRLKVGDILEKAKILQYVRVNDWFENEKQRLGHLRDRASETGRRKEYPIDYTMVWIIEILELHVDSHMDPNYESAEETDEKGTVGKSVNQTRPDTTISRRISRYLSTVQNHPKKVSDSSHLPKSLSTESAICGSGARSLENSTANRTMYGAGPLSSSVVTMTNDTEPEKVWHYKDPSGNVQGPFTLLQLSNWTSYFPRDLRVWLTFESEERSLLLTEVLSKQQKDFTQAASHTSSKATLVGTGHTRNNPSVDQTNAFSPVGHSVVSSSGIPVQYNKYSVPERESVYSPDDSLSLSTSSVPPKDAYTVNSQAHCQNKHSVFIQSPGSSYGHTDLNHDGIQGGCSGESNHHHSSRALWSPTVAHVSCGRGNVESHQNQHVSWSESQHESKNGSQGGFVKDLNSRQDLSKNLPAQRIGKDVSSPLFAWSPAESRTASSQQEGSCLSSTTNPSFLDELHSSIASAKPKSCAPATPIEDRGSSSPSDMLSHEERVPICSPQSAPLASASDMCKMEEIMNQQRTLVVDTSNASVNQSPESRAFPVSSPDNQDIDREFPSPVPRSENKDIAVDSSELAPASPENITTNLPVSDTCKMEEVVSQQQVIGAVVSNSSDNHSPQSKVSPVSSNNEDTKHKYPSSTPRPENKNPAVDSLLSTSAAPENLTTTSTHDSDTCKMEVVNQPKTFEADASNAPLHQLPHSHSFLVPSDNQDIECECPGPTPRSDSEEALMNNSATTASASDTSKMEEFVNQQKTLEADSSNAPLNQSPHSHIFSVPSDKQDIERECPGPTQRSDTKEPLMNNSVLTSGPSEIQTTASAASDTCKMEESVDQPKALEADASNAPLNHHPHSHIFRVSSDNQDNQCEHPSPNPKSDSKEPLVDNSVLTSVVPGMLATTSASDKCKMEEFANQQKALEVDASNASFNQPHIFAVSSDNQDMERERPSPTPRSECKESLTENSVLTSLAPEILARSSASASDKCKTEEFVNQQKPIEADASNASLNQPHVFAVPSDNQDIERECPSPTPRSECKESFMENSVLTSAVPEIARSSVSASDTCKMEFVNQQRPIEADASNASLNQPRIFAISSDNKDIERECPNPTPRSECKESIMENSVLTSAAPEILAISSASASDTCKMEFVNQQRPIEADASNASLNQPHIFAISSDNKDIERECPSPTPRSECKESLMENSVLTPATPEILARSSASASDTCKMEEFVKQQRPNEADASNASLNQPHIFTVSSDNKDIERECPSPTPRSECKESLMENSVLTSAAPERSSASASDTCKMEFVNQQRPIEADAPNASLNQCRTFAVSSDTKDIERECPSPTPRSECKESLMENSVLTSAAPEILARSSASASDTCKMEEFVNQQRLIEADASNASLNQPHIFAVSSDNKDIERECPSPTPRSECKESLMENSVLTSAAPEILVRSSASASDTCKMEEFVNQQRPIEVDASNASLNQPPRCHIFTASSNNQDIERECPSSTPRSDSKEPFVDNLVLTSAVPGNLLTSSAVASDTCKMEILNKKITLEADASNAPLNQPPLSSVFASSSGDDQDNVCGRPSPNPRPEGEQPLMGNSGLISTVPRNLTSTSASASDICKMEILNEKRTLEANPSNGLITQSPQPKVFLVPSPDILECEFSSETPRHEFKEPVADSSGLTSAAHENLGTKPHVHSPDAFVPPKSGALTGELGDTKSDFKGEETIQKEQYFGSESIAATRENLLIDPSSGVESIDVSDVLDSLMEERSGTSYMPGSIEDFLAEEEPQYSSPIALSPWGEPSYYQGDAVDSALWGTQDLINDMWSLLSPRPMLQPSSGIGTEGKETFDINEVAVTHVSSDYFQKGSMFGEENVNQANLSAAADWMLPEQVPSIPNGMSTSSVDESTIVLGSQPSTNQSLDWGGTTWSIGQNASVYSNEKAEPSSKSYWEEPRKQETAKSSVSISGQAIGNNKGLDPRDNAANRGSRLSHHHRGRYSQISESWLLSSSHSRSRSDRFGSGGSSRSTSKGQSRG
ncbi:Zinc finger CCCH domain-containing protein 19 [Zea mays]|uniref:Zinc finger CCCH domain-containing protein 19 n=2 Tax=Zea mays TaxID=4577 RepID=A0A1D6JL09_MAIZE|nr:Zinc finger CCCH domain-containing protein 19 [Zea mays]